jgi:hypothetical protein
LNQNRALAFFDLTRFFTRTGTHFARKRYSMEGTAMAAIDPLTAGAVLLATAATDAVYVMFTSAVVARKRVPAATWSSVWYLLSSYAVISYTENWVYVAFAAVGSWLGAFAPAARRSADRRGAGVADLFWII